MSDASDDEDLGYLDGYWAGDNQDVNQNDDKQDPICIEDDVDDAEENAHNDDVIGYDKAYRDAYRDYRDAYRDYTSDDQSEGEEHSDSSEESESESESESDSDSDKDKDEDHKYTYKYKYKYAYKPSDNPAIPSPNPDKPSDNPAKPKNKPKDDKQTDQKYSVNCISTRKYDTDSDESDREIVSDAQMRSLKLANEKFYRTSEKF